MILAETASGALSTTDIKPGVYLTDGLRLFRVVRGFSRPAERSHAVLEDCRTLVEEERSPEELFEMGLELVRSGAVTA